MIEFLQNLSNNFNQRQDYLKETILSISGWRRIFPSNINSCMLVPIDKIFLSVCAYVIGNYFLKEYSLQKDFKVIIAQDSRKSGKEIFDIFLQIFYHLKIEIVYLGITSLPQTLSLVSSKDTFKGVIYFSASHNPQEYNGIKIGESTGEVLKEKASTILAKQVKDYFLDNNKLKIIMQYTNEKVTLQDKELLKKDSYESSKYSYQQLIEETINIKNTSTFKDFKNILHKNNVKIICDFNGSARLRSADENILNAFNVNLLSIGNHLGKFSHRIVPEGAALLPLKQEMLHLKDENILFGYVVDCDGDRGNFLFYNNQEQVKLPDAQTTFALTVISELAFIKTFFPEKLLKTAIVANGPTSLRIDDICKKFGVTYFKSEVGEANVLKLVTKKCQEGYFIPVAGEGSNGGCLINPSKVRDPLSSIFSILKLLFLRNSQEQSLLEIAFNTLNINIDLLKNQLPKFIITNLISHLSSYQSTSVFEEEALIKVKTTNQSIFKNTFEDLFEITFKNKYLEMKKEYQFETYEFINFEGSEMKIGKRNRTLNASGGLMILFQNALNQKVGFLWFRASKTEPVYRISSEIKGNEKSRKKLLTFLRELLILTDNKCLKM